MRTCLTTGAGDNSGDIASCPPTFAEGNQDLSEDVTLVNGELFDNVGWE